MVGNISVLFYYGGNKSFKRSLKQELSKLSKPCFYLKYIAAFFFNYVKEMGFARLHSFPSEAYNLEDS